MLNFSNGVSFPLEMDGLPFVSSSPVNERTIALLYSNAQGLGFFADNVWVPNSSPSGNARILLTSDNGLQQAFPLFELPTRWARFAMIPDGGWITTHAVERGGQEF